MGKSKSRTAKPDATASRADQPVQNGSKAAKELGESPAKRELNPQESESQTKPLQPKEKAARVVGIRTSGDGHKALVQLLEQIQSNSGMTFVFAQHLDPEHEHMLIELLAKATEGPVKVVKENVQQELTKAREELERRNLELNRLHNDLANLLSNVHIPLITLDNDLRVRRITPMAQKVANVVPSDVGRRITETKLDVNVPGLENLVLSAIKTSSTVEREIQDQNGHWYSLEVRSFRTSENKQDGVVLTLFDIDGQKRVENNLSQERKRGQMYLDVAGDMLLLIDSTEKVGLVNKRGCELLGYAENEIIGKNWFDSFIPERVRVDTKAFFSNLMASHSDQIESYENPILTKSGQEKTIAWRATNLKGDSGTTIGMLCSGEDTTALRSAEEAGKHAEAALRENKERFRIMAESLGDFEFFIMDPTGYVVSWTAAERVKGYREDEIVGQHFSTFYPVEDFQAGRPMKILSVAEAEGRFEEDGWRIRKSGSRNWANVVITALRDEAGKLSGFSSITRYIGERKWGKKLQFN